jgi:hypothetical protein
MEVVNGPVVDGPTAGLPFWYARLNEGYRIVAIGGSDDHAARSPEGRIGSPSTVVFAPELSEQGVVTGLRSGRVYIRTRGPVGPTLDLVARTATADIAMGGVIPREAATPATLSVLVLDGQGQALEVVRGGAVIGTTAIATARESIAQALNLERGEWVHVRLRDRQGLTALSNPIYVE